MERRDIDIRPTRWFVFARLLLAICTLDAVGADAQEVVLPSQAAGVPSPTADRPAPAESISHALNKKGTWEFQATPLHEVVQSIRTASQIDIVINARALEDFDISTDVTIDGSVKDVSLRSFLRIALGRVGLTYCIYDGALWITTKEEAESHLSIRTYPVTDLVRINDEPGEAAYDYDELIDVIRGNLAPDSWSDIGSTGSIQAIYGSLVVLQADDVHQQLSGFLSALREVARQTKENPQGPGVPVFATDSKLRARILTSLEERLSLDIDSKPLSEVVEFLSQSTGLPMVLDTRALQDYGLGRDVSVTARVTQLPLRMVLRRLLDPHDLTWTVRDEVLSITTCEASEENLPICVYPVYDLVAPYAGAPPEECDFDTLVELLEGTVAPDSWEDGKGPERTVSNPPALVISQTDRIHELLRATIDKLRRAKQIEREARKALSRHDPALLVRTYEMKPGHAARDVLPLVIRLLGDDILEGEGVLLEALGNDLVVRHHQRGHRRIRALLFTLWAPGSAIGHFHSGTPAGFGGGGGFF